MNLNISEHPTTNNHSLNVVAYNLFSHQQTQKTEVAVVEKELTAFEKRIEEAADAMNENNEVWLVNDIEAQDALRTAGYANAVATDALTLSPQQARQLKEPIGNKRLKVILAFDKGQSTEQILPSLLLYAEVVVISDFASIATTAANKPKELERAKNDAPDAIMSVVLNEWDDALSAYEKASLQRKVAMLVGKIPDKVTRDIYIRDIASMLKMNINPFKDAVKEARSEKETKEKNAEAANYRVIKVLDNYYEKQIHFDPTAKSSSFVYVRRSKEEIKDEGTYLSNVPKFTNWICEPRHIGFRYIVDIEKENFKNRFFNAYQPLPYKPTEFTLPVGFDAPDFDYTKIREIENTAKFFAHIANHKEYGNKYLTLLWDYFALMYLLPEQNLQALCLVSTEEGTGKSTMLNYWMAFFGQNATKTTAERITANFNGQTAYKVFVGVEETNDQRSGLENYLKDLITATEKVVEMKFENSRTIASFEKMCFCSNHPETFLKVGSATTRFAVLEVPKITEKTTDMVEKMVAEIPYVMHFLEKRGIHTPCGDRLWFKPSLWQNEALTKLQQASKEVSIQNLEALIESLFMKTEWATPIMPLGSETVKQYMEAYAGLEYTKKTPTYFARLCREKMKLQCRDKPTTFEYPYVTTMGKTEVWEASFIRDKSRFIEFPIWRFMTPENAVESIQKDRLIGMVEYIRKNGGKLSAYLEEATSWANEVMIGLGIEHKQIQSEIPYPTEWDTPSV